MKQTLFEWHEQSKAEESSEVVLQSKTIETVIMLMADALLAVVRVRAAERTEETDDER